MWALAFLLLSVVHSGWATQCDENVGPAGPTDCIQIPRYYNQYQWATCLSNAYIQQKVVTNTFVRTALQRIAGTNA